MNVKALYYREVSLRNGPFTPSLIQEKSLYLTLEQAKEVSPEGMLLLITMFLLTGFRE